MSNHTARTVSRLCGGTGLPQPTVALAKKPAALLAPFVRSPVDVVVPLPQPLPLAA